MTTAMLSPAARLAALALLVLTAAACGGSPDPVASPASPATQPTTPPADGDPSPDDCAGDCEPPEDILLAAQQEGEVVMYSGLGAAAVEQIAQAFDERYGITFVHTELPSVGAVERVHAEFVSGRRIADVLLASPGVFEGWAGEGVIRSFDESHVPNLAGVSSAERGDGFFSFGGPAYTLAWNEDLLPDGQPPSGYCELTDPKWNNLVGMTVQSGGGQWGHIALLAEVCGDDYLRELGDNNLIHFPGTVNATQSLGAGEYAVLVTSVPYLLSPLQAQGAPLDYTLPEEGVTVNARWLGVVADSPNPNAALVFANFLLSEEVQTILYTGDNVGYSVLPAGTIDGVLSPPGRIDFTDLEKAAEVEPRLRELLEGR